MKHADFLLYLAALSILTLSCGCLGDATPLTADAQAFVPVPAGDEPPDDLDRSAARSAGGGSASRALNRADAIGPDELPHPERKDPFHPVRGNLDREIESPATAAAPVHLHGFINAGRPAALLSIEGRVVPLAAGEAYRGVRVLRVASPAVTLQRGARTWTMSLSDQVARRPAEKTAAD